jgi:hypothetical protein
MERPPEVQVNWVQPLTLREAGWSSPQRPAEVKLLEGRHMGEGDIFLYSVILS